MCKLRKYDIMDVREERHLEKEFKKDGKEEKKGKGSGKAGADTTFFRIFPLYGLNSIF